MACVGYASSARAVCIGDCNGDNMVAINELIIGVNIALGATPLSACPSFDADGNGEVGINELITAVNNALGMCPTVTPGRERVFTIEPGELLATPDSTRTGLFTSGLSGANASDGFSEGPLTLVLGNPDASGVAPLSLKEDVTLRIGVVDGSYLCFILKAEDSAGSMYCGDGQGPPYDTRGFQPAGDVGFPFEVTTGLGGPSGPGDGNLLIPVLYQLVGLDSPDYGKPCNEVTYENPLQTFPFTTTTAISDKGNLNLEVDGEPFDCDDWETSKAGMLAAPAPATQAPIGDVSNVFRLGEAQ
ncbi:MAG: hypothetical protein SF182_27750 [Deltaproteobacteria bacterium]|nr:hypothetical protein [Deltaproteobacteria bacterium]